MGLKSDIKDAYITHLTEDKKTGTKLKLTNAQDEKIEDLAQDLTDAIVNFLTHNELHFTVSKLKASVELEELKLSAEFDANIKMTRTLSMLAINIKILKMLVQIIMAPIKWAANQEIAKTKPLSGLNSFIKPVDDFFAGLMKLLTTMIPKTEGQGEIEIPALDFNKAGGKHGDAMYTKGYAYIGEDSLIPESDTVDPDSDFNQVRLYRDKISDKLLG